MIVHINGKVDDEMLEKFIQMYNTESNEYLVYFTTSGGSTDTANAIVDLINKNAHKTTIYAYSQILSSGFYIFYATNCKKEVDVETIGMWHQGISDLSMNENGTLINKAHKIAYKLNKTIGYNKTIEFANNLGFTDKEMKELKRGDNVYFLSDRLNEFLKQQTIQDATRN